jgi:hypothetical protein
MHGGGAKLASFKKNFQIRVKFKICFKFGLKIKIKILHMYVHSGSRDAGTLTSQ